MDSKKTEEILLEYKDMVRAKAQRYYIFGGDTEDLIQEGMIGLYQAAESFDESKGVPFASYAAVCVERRLISAVRASQRGKNRALNDSVSLDEFEEFPLAAGPSSDPAYNYELEELRSEIGAKLSAFENKIFAGLLEGKTPEQLSKELSKEPKSIYNAIGRIKKKLQ